MLCTSHQTQTGISQEISWIHQDCAQKARHKWFKKGMKEKNRKGRIMMTVSQEIVWNPSDFCCWRKKGYLQRELLLPHCSRFGEGWVRLSKGLKCAVEGCGVCCTAVGVSWMDLWAHPDRSFGVWNPFEIPMLWLDRHAIFSAHQSPNVDPFLQLVVQFCVLEAPHHGGNSAHLPGAFFPANPTFSFSCVLGFNPTPAKHHACKCRISPTALCR